MKITFPLGLNGLSVILRFNSVGKGFFYNYIGFTEKREICVCVEEKAQKSGRKKLKKYQRHRKCSIIKAAEIERIPKKHRDLGGLCTTKRTRTNLGLKSSFCPLAGS